MKIHLSIFALLFLLLLGACGNDEGTGSADVWGYRGARPGLFSYPRAIEAGDNLLLVIDRTGRLQLLDLKGTYLREWQLEKADNGTPTGMTLDATGDLWIPDTHNSRILKYDLQGNRLQQFGSYGEEEGKFIYPTDLAIGDDGNLYIAEYGKHDRVQVFTPAGEYLRGWGNFGEEPGQFNRPMAIVKGKDGLLYLADSVNHRIQVFTQEGTWVRILGKQGSKPGEFLFPYDLDFGPDGNLYVCEFGNHRIQKITPEGNYLKHWGELGSHDGQLSEPWGIVVQDSRIYVADAQNHRITVFNDH